MAHSAHIREKARELRVRKRLTIDELAECLAVPRTTVYHWVRDLPIGQTDRRTLAARRAGEVTKAIHRQRRTDAYHRGVAEYPELLRRATFRDFVCMYIGEGSKRSRNVVAICNSDPAVIRLGAFWICRFASNPVVYSFQHHADQDPEELQRFWAEVVKVDPAEIKFQRKSNSGGLAGRIWRSSHGVLQVRAPDTYLRSRLQAWMDCLRAEWP